MARGLNIGVCDIKYANKGAEAPFYGTWRDMLTRAYNPKYSHKYPTYESVEVCEEWLTFSNFKSWMETQDWKGKVLDKDLISGKGKVYSPETCCFINPQLNSFLTFKKRTSTSGFIGASYQARYGKYIASCSDLAGKNKNLGRFSNPLDAHLAWLEMKSNLLIELFDKEQDFRVKEYICLLRWRMRDSLSKRERFDGISLG